MIFSAIDHAHMALALRLAERGIYTTQPNPRVGCVIAHGADIVGQGTHQRAGEAHAEVFALREAGDKAKGATAYVTLEPCAHFGKTPPCANALIEAGVARVVSACTDPNPRVAGGGVARLREAGIVVDAGLMEAPARELNHGFLSRLERGRPWVRIKQAMSMDGRIALANGESKWVSGEAARADVQRWRARSSALMTGIGTVLADNPRLTRRLDAAGEIGFKPLRVVLDSRLRTPADANIVNEQAPTLIFHSAGVAPVPYTGANPECVAVDGDGTQLDLLRVMQELANRGVNELQVEAGSTLCGSLFREGLVDEMLLYVAPLFLGSDARALLNLPPLADMAGRWSLRVLDQRQVGNDLRLRLRKAA